MGDMARSRVDAGRPATLYAAARSRLHRLRPPATGDKSRGESRDDEPVAGELGLFRSERETRVALDGPGDPSGLDRAGNSLRLLMSGVVPISTFRGADPFLPRERERERERERDRDRRRRLPAFPRGICST